MSAILHHMFLYACYDPSVSHTYDYESIIFDHEQIWGADIEAIALLQNISNASIGKNGEALGIINCAGRCFLDIDCVNIGRK